MRRAARQQRVPKRPFHVSDRVARALTLVGVGLALSALFLGFASSPASAHNTFLDSSPADGERLAVAPSAWSVSFASEVPLDSASAEVVRADGTRTALPAPTHGSTTSTIVFALPADLEGSVTARWRLVGTDGHVISGRVAFAIGDTPTASSDGSPSDTPQTETVAAGASSDSPGLPASAQTALRWFNYLALLTVGGLFASEAFFARGTLSNPIASRSLTYGAAVLAGVPVIQTLQLAADVSSSSLIGAVGRISDALSLVPGQMTALRSLFGGILAAVAVFGVRERMEQRHVLVAASAGAGYLITLAYAGHSRSQGTPWLGVPVDVLHTAAVVYWLGGLAMIVFVIAPMLDGRAAVDAYRRFGDGARIAVPAILATGVIQTARLHGGITSLFTTSHGRLLLVKILVVASMLKFADRNRRMLGEPSRPGGDRRLRRDLTVTALAETGIGLVVVAVTAVLVTSSLS